MSRFILQVELYTYAKSGPVPNLALFIDETGEAWFTTISHERMGGSKNIDVIEELKDIIDIKVNR